MIDLIEKSYTERTTLKTVSAAVHGKPETLGRIFHQVVGVSVHDYVTRVRLDHAAHFIRAGGLKIEAVAHSVGYRSKKNFYRQFSKHFGVTPEAYRRGRAIKGDGQTAAKGNSGRRTSGAMITFTATFGHIECLVGVEARASLKGRSTYCATPFVKVPHGIQPFAPSDYLEISGPTEAETLERAAVFLEHRFGRRQAAPSRFRDGVLMILTPRR
jgi:AraC-like DNA-binding protein